jgi:glycosyltransferase involved in cell wall biosynthesis
MRVIYLNLFSRQEITGGIKIAYRCAELLKESGYDAAVWQPDGAPVWLETSATVISDRGVKITPDDILIFPEALNPPFVEILKQQPAATKLLFCQNPYNLFSTGVVPRQTPRELGFSRILCVSEISKQFLARTFHYDDIAVMPIAIDPAIFRPRRKILQIAYAPRKLRWHADLVRKVFVAKFPEMRAIPWVAIDGVSEARAAEIMGESHVYLATGQFESCPLMALEAMSSGCAVVGYHGYGGLEYATPRNGFWHFNDEIEEVVDDLYRATRGIETGDALIAAMIAEGRATAARFNAAAMRARLIDFIETVRLGAPALPPS